MGFWGWVGALAAGWFAGSVLLAFAWWRISAALGKPAPKPDRSNVYDIDREGWPVMAAKKKEPTFWSVSANGESRSGGYAQRNKRKQASGQGCAVLMIAGAFVAAGATEAVRWLS